MSDLFFISLVIWCDDFQEQNELKLVLTHVHLNQRRATFLQLFGHTVGYMQFIC